MSEVAERSEMMLPGPAEALGGLLGVPVPDLSRGEALPLLWHWMYLLDRPRQADLGPDGHPVRGTIPVPPGPGYRRMWAGGRVRMHGPLRCGDPAAKRSRVLSVQHKQGRSGPLTFVVVEHQVLQHGQPVIDEQQDIVYREAGSTSDRPENPPGATPVIPAAADEWAIDTPPTVLFRFSALTYNAHRIHYDRDYARDVEGYPGLLTHGPLQALAMAEAARARGYGARPFFEYRLTSPLFDFQGLVVRAAPAAGSITTAARDLHGRPTASGTLQVTG
jgi:3-methylfumaryl-CoA hydratase